MSAFQSFTIAPTRCPVSDAPAFGTFLVAATVHMEGAREGGVVESSTASLLGAEIATSSPVEVRFASTGLKMIRIHAVADPAQVIKVNSAFQWPVFSNIESSMGKSRSEERSTHVPVSVGVQRPLPSPAPSIIHDVTCPVIDQGRVSSASDPTSPVMLLAHAQLKTTGHALRVPDNASVHRFHGSTIHQAGR